MKRPLIFLAAYWVTVVAWIILGDYIRGSTPIQTVLLNSALMLAALTMMVNLPYRLAKLEQQKWITILPSMLALVMFSIIVFLIFGITGRSLFYSLFNGGIVSINIGFFNYYLFARKGLSTIRRQQEAAYSCIVNPYFWGGFMVLVFLLLAAFELFQGNTAGAIGRLHFLFILAGGLLLSNYARRYRLQHSGRGKG